MTSEGTTEQAGVPAKPKEQVRDEMYRLLEEIAKSGDRNAKAKFEALWKQIGEPTEPTLH